MAASHFVNVGLINIDVISGNPILKNAPTTTLGMMLKTSTEPRVLPDASVPNSANYPTVKAYLALEIAGGFSLKHMDQYVIITEG